MAVSYWVPNVGGTLDEYLSYPVAVRRQIRRSIRDITKALRDGGTMTGHPRSDRKAGL